MPISDGDHPILLEGLNRTEVAELAPDGVLVLPVGATEQHGPDLALGTDAAIVTGLVHRAAAGTWARPVVVAPTLAVGQSQHHLFATALSLRPTTYLSVLADLIASAVRSGFGRVLLVNGHGGNADLIKTAAADAACTHHGAFAAISYWTLLDEDARGGVPVPGHAGRFEAGLLADLRPDLLPTSPPAAEPERPMLDTDVLGPGTVVARSAEWSASGGFSEDPTGELPMPAEDYRERIVAGLRRAIERFSELPLN